MRATVASFNGAASKGIDNIFVVTNMRRNFFLMRPVDQGWIKSLPELILLLIYKKSESNHKSSLLLIYKKKKVFIRIFLYRIFETWIHRLYTVESISTDFLLQYKIRFNSTIKIRNLKYLFFLPSVII